MLLKKFFIIPRSPNEAFAASELIILYSLGCTYLLTTLPLPGMPLLFFSIYWKLAHCWSSKCVLTLLWNSPWIFLLTLIWAPEASRVYSSHLCTKNYPEVFIETFWVSFSQLEYELLERLYFITLYPHIWINRGPSRNIYCIPTLS